MISNLTIKNYGFLLIVVLLFTSCYKTNRIYYTKNIKKTIHNLEEMQRWLHQDFESGDIPKHIAENYMVVVINSKCSLYKKLKESNTDCVD